MTFPNFSNEDIQKLINENRRMAAELEILKNAAPEPNEGRGFFSKLWSDFKTPEKLIRISSDSELNSSRILGSTIPIHQTPNSLTPSGLIPTHLDRVEFENSSEKADSTATPNQSILNESKLMNDLMGQTSTMATQSSIMASHMIKSIENVEVGTVKTVKSVDSDGILLFLSKYIPDSVQSAVYQIPKKLRVPLGQILKIPDDISLINYYKGSVGVNQKFIQDMTRHILSDEDFDYAIPKNSKFSITKLYEMIASCKQKLRVFGGKLSLRNNLQIKKAMLSNIGPQVLYDYLSRKYGDLILSYDCSIIEVIDYIEEAMIKYSKFIKQQKEINPQATDLDDKKESKDKKKGKKPVAEDKIVPADDKTPDKKIPADDKELNHAGTAVRFSRQMMIFIISILALNYVKFIKRTVIINSSALN